MAKGAAGHGVSMATLNSSPHGIDLGPLEPSLFERLETEDGRIHCAPAPVLADMARFRSHLETIRKPATFTLIGRRHLRSNNSWMHNSHRLIKGKPRDQLLMHPDDLATLGLGTDYGGSARARGSSRIAVGHDTLMRGVVSLPTALATTVPARASAAPKRTRL